MPSESASLHSETAPDVPPLLITGAAGFIGAGLSRALAAAQSAPLILLDVSEQALIDLEQSLPKYANVCRFVLGNAADRSVMRSVLRRFRPRAIIHAAAYKHVVTLEYQLEAALRNNTLASFDLASEAVESGVESFLLVSTDKAVEPHSMLGATKRAAELLTLSLASERFRVNAIRLGNVLGSTGSVLPLFERQARENEPLTITHPDAARWFYTLADAAALIQAALQSEVNGRILIPHQARERRIVDLAHSLAPDAPLRFVGLRPGEKLTESFVGPDEIVQAELATGLRVLRTRELTRNSASQIASRLHALLWEDDRLGLLRELRELIPEYVPSDAVLTEVRS